ncbi:MAG: esterase [Nostocales cyanobacterium]|nr:MAG: esterase [Nostocales cyanobacterium]TAF14438.1 MAG: esterase [Nostocales cyanobacterium]
MLNSFIYLHGFASSPKSYKAENISYRFEQMQINLKVPDLNAGDFSHLTITRQINQVVGEFPDSSTPITLIGSSLGGLTSAYLGEKYLQVERLILLAPAFGFLSHWLSQLGTDKIQQWQQEKYLSIYHYGEKKELPLSYNFITDARQYQEHLLQRPIPTLILHGKEDEVIPIQSSRDFARSRPWVKLIELDSDHALNNVIDDIWQAIYSFLSISY